MAGYQVQVDKAAFDAALPAAIEDLRQASTEFIILVADFVVRRAKELAPKGATLVLENSISASLPSHEPPGLVIEVSATDRAAVFMEFGTVYDRPEPFMRPALAEAAHGLHAIDVIGRLTASTRARLFVRRMRARGILQKQSSVLHLSAAEQRTVSRQIGQRLRYRGSRVTYRRPKKGG